MATVDMIENQVLINAWYRTDKTAAALAHELSITEGSLKAAWWRLKSLKLLPNERKKYNSSRNPRPLPVVVYPRDNFDTIDGRPIDDGQFLLRLRTECPDWKPGDPHP